MTKIAVSSGLFKADEVIAVALMSLVDDVEVVRTRNADVWNRAELVISIGREYSPTYSRYDHHHFKKNDPFYGLCSASLVYKDLRPFFRKQGDIEGLDDLMDVLSTRTTSAKYDKTNVYEPIFIAIEDINDIDPTNHEIQASLFNVLVPMIAKILKILLDKKLKNYAFMLEELEEIAEQSKHTKNAIFKIRSTNYTELDQVLVGKYFEGWRKVSKAKGKPFVTPGDKEGQFKIMMDTSERHIVNITDRVFLHGNGFLAVSEPEDSYIVIYLSDDAFQLYVPELKKILKDK